MQPEHSLPKLASEQAPANSAEHFERGPVQATPETNVDTGIERGVERHEQAAESSAIATEAASIVAPVATPPVIDDTQVSDSPVISDDSPIVAGDDDLIEKEWVDKAKKIINDTKNDPYLRDEEVSKLQKAYLKKRYGKDLGETE